MNERVGEGVGCFFMIIALCLGIGGCNMLTSVGEAKRLEILRQTAPNIGACK